MRELLLLFFGIFHIAYCSCPDGFELVADGQCRGYLTNGNFREDEATGIAISKCKEIGAMPVIIHNEEEQSYWTAQYKSTNAKYGDLLLGLLCNSTTQLYEWADGSPVDYIPSNAYSGINNNCDPQWSWIIHTDGEWTYYGSPASQHTYSIFCISTLRQPVPSVDGCDNFEDDNDDGVCYQIGSIAENFQEAEKICRSFGADLASIHNQKENSFIRRLAVSNGMVKGIFLGATISGKGNDFAWIDGSPWDYDNFNPGFPIKGFGDCLAMDTEGTSGQWVNTDCSSKLSVACMRKENYTAPSSSSCTSGVYTEGQIIYSPGFPYDSSVPCDFILTVDVGKKVEAEVLFLEANPCCDHLVLFDNFIAGNVMANLTGEISNKKYTTSNSNTMRVSWQPNGGVNVRGMMMIFSGV